MFFVQWPFHGQLQLDEAYDDHPYERSWLLQSLAAGAGVAASGLKNLPSWVLRCRILSAWFLVTSSTV